MFNLDGITINCFIRGPGDEGRKVAMALCGGFISSEIVRMQSRWQRCWDWPPLLSMGMAKDCRVLALHVFRKWRLSFCFERRDILPPSCLACVFDKINVYTLFFEIRFPTQIMFCPGWGKWVTDTDIHLCLNLGNNSESFHAPYGRKLPDHLSYLTPPVSPWLISEPIVFDSVLRSTS